MGSHQPNYRLTEGALINDMPTETQLWDAVRSILSSKKRSTYKFAFLQAIVDLNLASTQPSVPLSDLFGKVAAMYWRLLSAYPLRQIYKHAHYERSSIEAAILGAISTYPGVSFDALPADQKRALVSAAQKICSRNVLGASYGNSNGVLFGFSTKTGTLELSGPAKVFLTDYAAELSLIIELAWLSMLKQLNSDYFPEPLAMRLQDLTQEKSRLATKEGPRMSATPTSGSSNGPHDLKHIQEYVESANALLSEKVSELEHAALDFEKELKAAFPDYQTEKLIFQSRVKGDGSLAEKIYRKNYHNRYPSPAELIDNLPDMIGVRVVCLLNQQEERLFDRLRAIYTEPEVINGITFHKKAGGKILFDFSGQPQRQKNGQPIYRITCKWDHPRLGYINCELQLKSMVHFFWGELDHMLFYKNYSYLISQSFYSQYMLKVEHALSNINDQLVLLYDQIEENRGGSRQEMREIASRVLYQHYHLDIEELIGCPVDLREVFDIIVDMHFQNYGNQRTNVEKLSGLIHDIGSHSLRPELLPTVIGGTLDPTAFSSADFPFAKIVDRTLKSCDVFWIAFVVTYGSHFWGNEDPDYNILLSKICHTLMRMVQNGFVDTIEQLYDELEELYEAFKNAILTGVLLAFEQEPKLDFFIFSSKLDDVNKISEEVVLKTQKHISPENADECRRNLDAVTLYTYCKISAALYDRVAQEHLKKLIDLLQQEDPFALDPNFDQFESPDGKPFYTKQEFDAIFA